MNTEQKENRTMDIWSRVKTICLSLITGDNERNRAQRCFSMITNVTDSEDEFTITASNSYASDALSRDYADKISQAFQLAGAGSKKIVYSYDETLQHTVPKPVQTSSVPLQMKQRTTPFISTMPISPENTFEEFVIGPSNSWAHAAAKGAANNPGKKGYNPLFIHGGTGLGKTHLMQAIGNKVKKNNPTASVCYLTAERFLSEYVNSLQNGSMQQFHDRYRKIDVLLVDDVQFMSRGKDFQEEFFNTFNALYQAEKQIVMTSDVAPKDLPGIEPRLISRFEGGMLQEIEVPNYETRLAILKKKAESNNRSISESTLKFIANNIKSHVRAMEGALAKVFMMLEIDPTILLTDETLTHLLKDFIEKEKNIKKITIEEIQTAVCKKFSITMSQLLSNERTQSIVTPRQLAMYMARKFTVKKLPEISTLFDKTHATILHGVKSIEKRLDVEPELKQALETIMSEFGYNINDIVK